MAYATDPTDAAYAGAPLRNWCAARVGVELRVVRRPGRPQAAPPLRRDPETVDRGLRPPERTFPWLGRNRQMAKDYEARPQTTEVLMAVAMIGLMLRRLTRRCSAFRNTLSQCRVTTSSLS